MRTLIGQILELRSSSRRRRLMAAWLLIFAAAPGSAAAENCAGRVQPQCLKSLGAGAATAPSDCQAQLDRYRACLEDLIPAAPAARLKPGDARCSADQVQQLWAEVKEDGNCLSYGAFLKACPASKLAPLADARRTALACDAPRKKPRSQTTARPTPAPRDPKCIALGHTLTQAITVRRGSRLCLDSDNAKSIEITAVQRRGISYRNGPQRSTSCLDGQVCGVYWSTSVRFRVKIESAERGVAILEPIR